ncbi:WD40 repeat-like protein [Athelia psychrophila]|uniref:WD40 repeat-like protein n=1 Tax=Athelia psychrophila TaxID=1759441 RepID=A0A165Z8M0_9AGAM|nr:WD40 repeat-like protein [Fibularhizoctonia sp. CBS 109695]
MDATSRPLCLDGTRTTILQNLISDLTTLGSETNVTWLYGMAGSGKSTISTTVAEQLQDRGQRGAFLFFNRNSPAQSSPDGVIRTIAYQLAFSNAALRDAICHAIEQDTQIATRTLDAQFKALLMTMPMVIVLDAFDECGDAESRRALVYLLITNLPLLPHHFRFFITSRPELDLKNAFGSHPAIKSVTLSAAEWSSASDVVYYLRHELHALYQARTEKFGSRAGNSFIWAATGIRYLHAAADLDENSPARFLSDLAYDTGTLSQQAFSLADLYTTALRSASNWAPNTASTETCRRILGIVVLGRIPLTDEAIDHILSLEGPKSCRPILRKLGCLLQWSEGLPVRTLHVSFADYLIDGRACGDQPWFIDESKHHADYTIGCLHVMKKLLRFNICELKTSYLMNRDVEGLTERVVSSIPSSLAYACRFWPEHLRNANTRDDNVRQLILEFFRASFLYWLEVLSLIGEGRAALDAMVIVERYSKDHHDTVHVFAKDGIKFVGAFASIIADSAPHVYISTLPFAPSTSVIKQCYLSVIKRTLRVTNSTRTDWPSCEQVIEGHNTDRVNSVAFSPDGERVASGSNDRTIRIWDARTGKLVAGPFEGHTRSHVASCSNDKTIRIWDARTGKLVAGPFEGHTGQVNSVVLSPNGQRVASCSDDKTILIWDARTGKLVAGPFRGHTEHVCSVAFSPDGECVASGARDNTIRIWDAHTGRLVAGPFEGHTAWVQSVAFSPDGERVASGARDNTIRIWDARTGKLVAAPFEGHKAWVQSVAFSPDGGRVTSGSWDNTIRIWDARTGKLVAGPLKGHTAWVRSVAFSPDGECIASGSWDNTIRIWDARTELITTSERHRGPVNSVTFSPDGERVASGSSDRTIRIWDARTGKLVAGPFKGHREVVNSVAFSPDGKRVASSSNDGTIRIWDARTGKLVAGPFEGPRVLMSSVAFSSDGERVAYGSCDQTIRIWDARTGKLVAGPFEGHTAFCVASSSWDNTIRIWDARTGKLVRILSFSTDLTIRIWDIHTGTLVAGPFETHTDLVRSAAFSLDGEHIMLSSYRSTIHILDAHNGKLVAGPFQGGHIGLVNCAAFSPDGEHIASGSDDMSIHIRNARTGALLAAPFKGHAVSVTSATFADVSSRSKEPRSYTTSSTHLTNGWMQKSPTELLFWVPPEYRTRLWRPSDTLVIGQPCTYLDLTHFVYGENWAQCHI